MRIGGRINNQMKMMIRGSLKTDINSLNLALTLKTGQNFRWRRLDSNKKNENSSQWLGVLNNLYVVQLDQSQHEIQYQVINTNYVCKHNDNNQNKMSMKKLSEHFDSTIRNYFSMDVDVEHLYRLWSKCDRNFERICSKFRGIRLLRQDLVENIFSFICSSNNNIARITKMIDKLCREYGTKLYKSTSDNECDIYSFPSISRLCQDQIEHDLRKFGFGYRAKFINNAAKQIMSESDGKPDEWFQRLESMTYEDAKQQLMSLPGIGAKVADCICLMSLGFTEAIPIDTHVYKLTKKFYLPDLDQGTKKSSPSMTTRRYNEIGNFYREKFKLHAGWAQTILFCSDLKIK